MMGLGAPALKQRSSRIPTRLLGSPVVTGVDPMWRPGGREIRRDTRGAMRIYRFSTSPRRRRLCMRSHSYCLASRGFGAV